jgi:hypothetical protein
MHPLVHAVSEVRPVASPLAASSVAATRAGQRRSQRGRFGVASLLGAAVVAIVGLAEGKLERTGKPEVTFHAVGPGGLSIEGTSSELDVVEAGEELVVVVPLAKLDTKIDLRNKHLREKYLQVEQYPNAELRVAKASLKMPTGAPVSAHGEGTLTMHGRSKATPFHYTAAPEGGEVKVEGTLRLSMTDFGIATPSFMGVTVKPDVDVKVSFRVKGT